jgi:hypothetical protein
MANPTRPGCNSLAGASREDHLAHGETDRAFAAALSRFQKVV